MPAKPPQRLFRIALLLGYSGLLPQAALALLALHPPHRMLALTLGYFYATTILSFLGGIWWGVAVSRPASPRWLFVAAVIPSLVAFGTAVMWLSGRGGWQGILMVLGSALLMSVAVDWALHRKGLLAHSMLRLRLALSAGLGGLTLILGAL